MGGKWNDERGRGKDDRDHRHGGINRAGHNHTKGSSHGPPPSDKRKAREESQQQERDARGTWKRWPSRGDSTEESTGARTRGSKTFGRAKDEYERMEKGFMERARGLLRRNLQDRNRPENRRTHGSRREPPASPPEDRGGRRYHGGRGKNWPDKGTERWW